MATAGNSSSITLNTPGGNSYGLYTTTVNVGKYQPATYTYTTTSDVYPIYTMGTSTPTYIVGPTTWDWSSAEVLVDQFAGTWDDFSMTEYNEVVEEDVAYEDMMAKEA